jgi:hypothetical protein
MKKIFFVAALLAVTLVAFPAVAKEGFYLGAFIPYNKITGDSADPPSDAYINSLDSGAGFGLRAGYGFNRYFAIEGALFDSTHKSNLGIVDQDFSGLTLDAKVNFPLTGHSFEPYLLLGVGHYELGDSSGKFKGNGSQFGVGIDFYLMPELSLNTGLTWRRITFDSNDFGITDDVNARVRTFDVGLTYHFL